MRQCEIYGNRIYSRETVMPRCVFFGVSSRACTALTLLVGWQEGHPACKKTEWWGAGMVICLERGADLHMAQLMPLPLTASCFSKIQVCFTFLVPAHLGSPGQRAIKRLCACVCVCVSSGAVDSHSPAGRPQGSSAFTDHDSRDVD